jgi:hypothetical protein
VGPIAVVAVLIASSRGGGLALGGSMRQSVADMLVRGLALLDSESGLVLSGLGAVEAGVAFLLARVGVGLVLLSGEAEPLLGLRRGALMTLLLLGNESRGSRGSRHGCKTGEELGRRWGSIEEARSRSRRRGRPWNWRHGHGRGMNVESSVHAARADVESGAQTSGKGRAAADARNRAARKRNHVTGSVARNRAGGAEGGAAVGGDVQPGRRRGTESVHGARD